MVTEKKKRTDLQVGSWLKDEWNKGTEQREAMAICLQEVNWDKAGSSCTFRIGFHVPLHFVVAWGLSIPSRFWAPG